MSVTPIRPELARDPAVRYHLLLVRGGSETDFSELVAATERTHQAGEWRGTIEPALDISSVEADARLARWSRQTGGLAIRVSRPDPRRWWLAVHHEGRRLFAMIHGHPAPDNAMAGNPLFSDAELGRDPLLDLISVPELTGSGAEAVRQEVAKRRAGQLTAALGASGLDVEEGRISRLLADEAPRDGNIAGLLDALGAGNLFGLTRQLPPDILPTMPSPSGAVGRTMVMGCAVPMVLGAVLFVVFSRMAMRATGSPFASLLFGAGAAWAGMYGYRKTAGRRALPTPPPMIQSGAALDWASDSSDRSRSVRPTAAALDTWGGLFYLLRDIAFFSGIDRPRGPTTLYLEAWAMGPAALVHAINRVASEDAPAEPLYDAAARLVSLRDELIDRHLAEEHVSPDSITHQVRQALRFG